jgi:hypothetical protein
VPGDRADAAEELPRIPPQQGCRSFDLSVLVGRAQEKVSQANESEDSKRIDRNGRDVHDLDHRLVEPERDAGDQAQRRGGSEDREKSAEASDRYAQGDLFGRDAPRELVDKRCRKLRHATIRAGALPRCKPPR